MVYFQGKQLCSFHFYFPFRNGSQYIQGRICSFNPIALRQAQIAYNFGLSGCNRVKIRLLLEEFCSAGKQTGPSCSKLTMSLVNVSLKFQTLISEIRHYFLLKKCAKASLIFSTKNISVFAYEVVKHLMS